MRIISPGENRRDLGHVPQLFALLVWHRNFCLCGCEKNVPSPGADHVEIVDQFDGRKPDNALSVERKPMN
ncbi:MAG TPA: hypothetical protein VGH51_04240 [Candidatus Angelobacter sp.]|jgi:hypothetical protein